MKLVGLPQRLWSITFDNFPLRENIFLSNDVMLKLKENEKTHTVAQNII